MTTIAPAGSWKSPITAELVSGQATWIGDVVMEGQDIYWLESRPIEGGRYTIMRRTPNCSVVECTPAEYYVRTTVHEYGGGAFTVANGAIYFANFRDQRLYRQPLGAQPESLTPGDGYRYADLVIDQQRNRLICIREDHTASGEPVNTIVGMSLSGGENGQVLVGGNDFYSSARLSPDGARLAFLTWNHPNMPWDGCELWVAEVRPGGKLAAGVLIAGGRTESIFQPEWSPDGVLYFVGESTGWWNLYRWKEGQIEAVCPMEAEFGTPQWVFGMANYAFASPTRILCCYTRDGLHHLAWLDTASKQLTEIDSPYTEISQVRCGSGYAAFIGGSPAEPESVIGLDTTTNSLQTLRASSEVDVDPGFVSRPEAISFPTSHGREAYALYYPPTNKNFAAPADELPPLRLLSHGGPTSATESSLNLGIQYWTSRGFAVLDVNYGGSSGYGREYRQRLNGQWGLVDVEDCCNGALYLAQRGLADRNRLTIRGGSAGGYTTLACLVFRNEVFRAGASYFGLADLERFVADTHKFESRYLSSLVGPYPEEKGIYFQRSPIHFVENLACPIILFQGDEDRIVPPSQSEMMFEAARSRGLPTAYLLFRGEQHGFRKSEDIKRSLEAELFFYSRIFGFEPADPIEPISIENL